MLIQFATLNSYTWTSFLTVQLLSFRPYYRSVVLATVISIGANFAKCHEYNMSSFRAKESLEFKFEYELELIVHLN